VRPISALGRSTLNTFSEIGNRVRFTREIIRGFGSPGTYMPHVFQQMRTIGVDSLPLAGIVAAFIGAVIVLQVRYQIFPGVDLSLVGLSLRMMVILELGPLLTGLVLTGRVGARMTAEIGTMRVTEQIDALETLAYDPVAYLVVPRLIAATLMLPILVIMANAIGVVSGVVVGLVATDVTMRNFTEGLRLGFVTFQITYSLLKATLFGGAIALVCTYEGYVSGAGAEGVGKSTARAVVISSVTILVLDAFTAVVFAPFLQE
jgi:phospholipid/cholesterol/gamma-HCH transport system permease protein